MILLNKPQGVICSCSDPQGRKTVLDLIPRPMRRGLHPVGRLDSDSRGALLLTNQGAITLQLTHPRYAHQKTYQVQVKGRPTATTLNLWRNGVELDGIPTQPTEIVLIKEERYQSLLKVILREGRNRQIRRVANVLGHPVLDLQRTAISSIDLGSLPEGRWRELTRSEWSAIRLDSNECHS
jgi:pseudouridine synthase